MSSEGSILTACPKKRSRFVWTSCDSLGGKPEQRQTVALVMFYVFFCIYALLPLNLTICEVVDYSLHILV